MTAVQKQQNQIRNNLFFKATVFFVLYYFYVWLIVNPGLIYHSFGVLNDYPSFSTGWLFLRQSLNSPGGLTEYVSAFFSQLYYFSWLGAFIITIVSWGICGATSKLIKLAGGAGAGFLCYLPALLLLITHNAYSHPLSVTLAMLVVLWISVLYQHVKIHSNTGRILLFIVIFSFLYYLAGGVSLLFVALACMFEVRAQRNLFRIAVFLICGFLLPWLLCDYIFLVDMPEIYLILTPFRQELNMWAKPVVQCLYFLVPVLVLSVMFFR